MKVSEAYKSIGISMTNPRGQSWGVAQGDRVVLTAWRKECRGMRVMVLCQGHEKPSRVEHLEMIRNGTPGFLFLATRKPSGEIEDVSSVLFQITALEEDNGNIYAKISRV